MTIREYWNKFEDLDSPFDDTTIKHDMDFTKAKKIYEMERKLRLMLSLESNNALDEYIASIFEDFTAYKPYHSKIADFVWELLKQEEAGKYDLSRAESKLPTPFSLDWEVAYFFKAWGENFPSLWEKIKFKFYVTEWFGLKYLWDEFPFRVRYYKDSAGLVALKLWRKIC